MPTPFKRCPDCGQDKPVVEFGRNASRRDGLQFYCKPCYAARSARAYRDRQRHRGKTVRERVEVPTGHKYCPGCKECSARRSRKDYLKRTFGLTPEDVDAMVAAQGGVCAICRTGEPKHIDHDHATGRVRGVLCGPCNMGLGLFGDSPQRLEAALRYLGGSAVRRPPATAHFVEQPPFAIELAGARLHAA